MTNPWEGLSVSGIFPNPAKKAVLELVALTNDGPDGVTNREILAPPKALPVLWTPKGRGESADTFRCSMCLAKGFSL